MKKHMRIWTFLLVMLMSLTLLTAQAESALPHVFSAASASSTPTAFAAATASASSVIAPKSTPTYCLTASTIVSRGQPGVRSIVSPIQFSS